jgi:hypothetical protein
MRFTACTYRAVDSSVRRHQPDSPEPVEATTNHILLIASFIGLYIYSKSD